MKKTFLFILILTTTCFFGQEKKGDSIQKWNIHGRFGFLINQSSFSNWASGGQDNVTGNITINYDFNYKNNGWNWDNKIMTTYGLSYVNKEGYRKTDDRFEYNSLLGLKSSGDWFFSFIANFRTQYTRGFDYKKIPEVSVSDFLSPAYLTFGPGILKKSDDHSLNLAPATARFTFVNDMFSGKFGVPEGQNSTFSLGFNFSGFYKFEIMENIKMKSVFTLYSDYLDNPQNVDIDIESTIFFTINKFITMDVVLHGVMDANASGKVQFRQVIGAGLKYSFHKKVIYDIQYF